MLPVIGLLYYFHRDGFCDGVTSREAVDLFEAGLGGLMDTNERKLNILLVDDSEDDALMARHVFGNLPFPHSLETLDSATTALDYLKCSGPYADRKPVLPDILLLDINMPGMDGLSMLKKMKSDLCLRRIPVIMLTTSASQKDITLSYDSGAASFITKPSNFKDYTEVMDRLGRYWLTVSSLPK